MTEILIDETSDAHKQGGMISFNPRNGYNGPHLDWKKKRKKKRRFSRTVIFRQNSPVPELTTWKFAYS
jgi:hypothetical protein